MNKDKKEDVKVKTAGFILELVSKQTATKKKQGIIINEKDLNLRFVFASNTEEGKTAQETMQIFMDFQSFQRLILIDFDLIATDEIIKRTILEGNYRNSISPDFNYDLKKRFDFIF